MFSFKYPCILNFLASGSFMFTFSLCGMKTSGVVVSTHSRTRSTFVFTSVSKFLHIFREFLFCLYPLFFENFILFHWVLSRIILIQAFCSSIVDVVPLLCHQNTCTGPTVLLMNSSTTCIFIMFTCWLVNFTSILSFNYFSGVAFSDFPCQHHRGENNTLCPVTVFPVDPYYRAHILHS